MKKSASKKSPSPQARRARIVSVALKLFAKQGAAHTKLLEVARAAKVDPSLITYYFPTLDQLYLDVIQEVILSYNAYMLTRVAEHPREAVRALEAYVKSYFEWASENRGMFTVFLHFYHLASFKPQFAALNAMTRVAGRDRVVGMLFKGMAEGSVVTMDQDEVRERAHAIQSIIIGGVVSAATEPAADERAAERAWQTAKRLIVPG